MPGQPAALTVSSVNSAGSSVPLRIEATAPTIVAANRAGNVLVIYAVGLGATDPPVADGAPAPTALLARTVTQPSVRVGGNPATVFYSGLAPGLVGVYQVNAILPAGDLGRRRNRPGSRRPHVLCVLVTRTVMS